MSAAHLRISFCSTAPRGASRPPRRPRSAATRRKASSTGLEALGRIAEFGAIVHGTTVGTNALLERKGARVGLITTPGLSRRARNAPPRPAAHLGPARRFHSRRRARIRVEVGERTLADGTIRVAVDVEEVAARARDPRGARRGGAGDRVHQRLRQSRQRARRRGGGARRLAERACGGLARDPAGNPRVRARFDDRAQRLSAAGRRQLSRSVCKARSRNGTSSATFISCSRTAA